MKNETNAEAVERNLNRMPEDVLNKHIYKYVSTFLLELFIRDHKVMLSELDVANEAMKSIVAATNVEKALVGEGKFTKEIERIIQKARDANGWEKPASNPHLGSSFDEFWAEEEKNGS